MPGGWRTEVEALLVEKLETVDAFVVFDLDDAPFSVGVVRSAPKVLVDGATWLARSQTYQLASFELQGGGASAGVNAAADLRSQAVASFVAEVEPWVASRRLLPTAARGVHPDELVPLRDADPRPDDFWERAASLAAQGIVASLEAALDGLDGRTLAIEGFDQVGALLAAEADRRGARVVAVGTAAGTAADRAGLAADVLAAQWAARGPDLVRELTPEPEPAGAVLGATADALVCGSRAGVVDHGVAAGCSVRALVPSGPIPVTAKALAVLGRAGVRVLPDFVTTAGPLLGGTAPALDGRTPPADVGEIIAAVLAEVMDHEKGPVLGACLRAESFLGTWREELPFGRPLA